MSIVQFYSIMTELNDIITNLHNDGLLTSKNMTFLLDFVKFHNIVHLNKFITIVNNTNNENLYKLFLSFLSMYFDNYDTEVSDESYEELMSWIKINKSLPSLNSNDDQEIYYAKMCNCLEDNKIHLPKKWKFRMIYDPDFISNKMQSNITFSDEQKVCVKKMLNFLVLSDHYYFGLYGYAGTGKTTIMIEVIFYFLINNCIKSIAFSAPTNKAVNIMKSKMKKYIDKLYNKLSMNGDITDFDGKIEFIKLMSKIDIQFMTLHKMLGYKNQYGDEGERRFVSLDKPSLNNYDIVVIDECSMLPMDMLLLIHMTSKCKNKIIFSGDPAQLPQVNEDMSYIFANDKKYFDYDIFLGKLTDLYHNNPKMKKHKNDAELYDNFVNAIVNMENITMRNVVRNRIPNVLNFFNNMREWIENVSKIAIGKYLGDGVHVYKLKKGENKLNTKWFKTFIEYQKRDMNNDDLGNMILVWTNAMCSAYNNEARNLLCLDHVMSYENDDILLFNDFYNFDEIEVSDDKKDSKKRFYTSEQIRVVRHRVIDNFDVGRFMVSNMKSGQMHRGKDPIVIDYTNLIESLNEKTGRKYKVYELYVTRLGDSSQEHKIIVLHENCKQNVENDKTTSSKLIKNFKVLMNTKHGGADIEFINNIVVPELWKQYMMLFVEKFANVSYGNSSTAHKAQGSTYKNVFVDCDDILKNRKEYEVKRCLYSAVTRSSSEIHLLV